MHQEELDKLILGFMLSTYFCLTNDFLYPKIFQHLLSIFVILPRVNIGHLNVYSKGALEQQVEEMCPLKTEFHVYTKYPQNINSRRIMWLEVPRT